MRYPPLAAVGIFAFAAFQAEGAQAAPDLLQHVQVTASGTIVTPGASVELPQARGHAAHANVHILHPAAAPRVAGGPYGVWETPASLACLYRLTPHVSGCNPQRLTTLATGGSRVIAIVDAYDDPNALADLVTYSTRFGLPAVTAANFSVVYAAGAQPPADSTGGWELETALDIEMAHALAPGARIVLVEAASNSYADLLTAETAAAKIVTAAGGGEVSNSWSGSEFSFETAYNSFFTGKGVVFLAATGDQPGASFPSVLANVVGVGGTQVYRNAVFNYQGQASWSETGGGPSAYVPIPAYQHAVAATVGTKRGTPDVSLVADPNSGVWVYDSYAYGSGPPGWTVLGGTSVATPAVAAIINNAAAFRPSSASELSLMYAHLGKAAFFTDVTGGTCANDTSGVAAVGYDFCTGIGTPWGRYGK
jgi:subtilase family serine protease